MGRYAILLSEVKPSSSSFVCDLDHGAKEAKTLRYCHSQDASNAKELGKTLQSDIDRANSNKSRLPSPMLGVDGQQF